VLYHSQCQYIQANENQFGGAYFNRNHQVRNVLSSLKLEYDKLFKKIKDY